MKIVIAKPKGSRYGWIPSKPDIRDARFRFQRLMSLRALPDRVDLRESANLSPVEDQGELGSCTANAWVGALEYLTKKDSGKPSPDYSRLFLYYNERVLINTVNEDSGANLRDGAKSLANQGVCLESSFPYDVKKFTKKPCAGQYREALNHQLESYHSIDNSNLNDLLACLAEGFPFVFGFTVYESFESPEVLVSGVANMPGPDETALGGHAVLAVGYNRPDKRFIVRNSWGTHWGQQGYFTIPFNYLTNTDLADDFWTANRMELQ